MFGFFSSFWFLFGFPGCFLESSNRLLALARLLFSFTKLISGFCGHSPFNPRGLQGLSLLVEMEEPPSQLDDHAETSETISIPSMKSYKLVTWKRGQLPRNSPDKTLLSFVALLKVSTVLVV